MKPEAREQQRMPRNVRHRSQHFRGELLPPRGERRDQTAVRSAVRAEPRRGRIHGALEDHGGAVVERMRERRVRLDPLEAVLVQRESVEERRHQGERMDRGADVVHEAG